jgi:hypothetical protein
MSRIHLMATCALAATMALGPALAAAGSMQAPSTGTITGDWDTDTDSYNAKSSQAPSLGSEFFHVKWTAGVDRRGQPRISGYVYDDYGDPAEHVQLQITALDASGHEIGEVTRPVAGLVPAEGDAYFDVAVPAASSYRVDVSAFDFLEFGQGQ